MFDVDVLFRLHWGVETMHTVASQWYNHHAPCSGDDMHISAANRQIGDICAGSFLPECLLLVAGISKPSGIITLAAIANGCLPTRQKLHSKFPTLFIHIAVNSNAVCSDK